MRETLGDGYVETLRAVHDDVPESADYVMYWWNHAAGLARAGKIARFGLITTNSLRQTYARRVTAAHLEAKEPLSLLLAIPDHPWVDSADGAAVRIAMTVGAAGEREGALLTVVREEEGEEQAQVEFARRAGRILPDLTVGPNVAGAAPLQANEALAGRGVQLMGSGFIVTSEEAAALGLGRVPGLEAHIRAYRNGRDLTNAPRGVMVLDLFGLSESQVRERFPQVYQWVLERVKPEREHNQRKTYREKWWVFGEPRGDLRPVLRELSRYIATVETSKHRFFTFLDTAILPDNRLVCIGCDDAYVLGVLSSLVHLLWDRAAGGLLEDRPVYNKSKCFDPFPFPDPGEADKARIRESGEALDRHRKERQALHPDLTITDMYNVLAKLRAGEALSEKEKRVHEAGLVSVLRRIHDDLDAAVLAAYGWPAGLSDEEVLARLVALNRERAEEERHE
ncbi:MAG: class I SAM-dependent DNA methyltransferase, partial [Candidatus Methylomirabilis sp.]|nr:class I SAM-dependent DNA methyltransferase [Deltaproteobacteria bacterium]